ncbi:MAG: ABC transporter substrate-binding protein [Clostridiaceae bacterium]|nr:ABC transporter substrate-binding protein [Clostridiaceae bacterium]
MRKIRFTNFLLLTFILIYILLFAACSGNTVKSESSSNNNNSVSNGYPMTFENYGRTVTINSKPQKVLTLGPNCTELFVALGLRDYIIGTSLANHSRGPLPEYEEQYVNMPQLNYSSATREAVITSGADFIYGIDWEFGDGGLDISELESYGIKVYMNSATTLEEQYQEILDIGRIFGIEDTAQDYVNDQKARIEAVQNKVHWLKTPTVLVYDSGNNGVFTCSGSNFESLLISLSGGKNIFSDLTQKQWITVSYEEVIARNPDIILIHDYDSPSVEEKIAEIKANDILSQLECVKNERFAVISLESVLPGNRMAYTVETLAKAFYPEVFVD